LIASLNSLPAVMPRRHQQIMVGSTLVIEAKSSRRGQLSGRLFRCRLEWNIPNLPVGGLAEESSPVPF